MKRFKMEWKRNGGRKVNPEAFHGAFDNSKRDLAAEIPDSRMLSIARIAAHIKACEAGNDELKTDWQGQWKQGVDKYHRCALSLTKHEQVWMYFSGLTFFFVKVDVCARLVRMSATYQGRQRAMNAFNRNDISWHNRHVLEAADDKILPGVQEEQPSSAES